jgi:hypothetical protein
MSWSTNRIYDNNGRIVISVEQPHLDFAMQRSSSCCAIAVAIRCAIPDARRVSVDLMWIKFTRNGRRFRIQTPAIGRDCILNLDAGNAAAVAPFVLKLRPEFLPLRPRPERAELRRLERAAKRDGLAQPTTPKRKPSASVAVLSQREFGLRLYKRAEAQAEALSKPSPPPRPVPSRTEMTKSELQHEFERAWRNTATLQPSRALEA